MKIQSMNKSQLSHAINNQRFDLMRDYLFLYGDRLRGKPSLYERFRGDEISLGSEEGQACMEVLMDAELKEGQLNLMLERFFELSQR